MISLGPRRISAINASGVITGWINESASAVRAYRWEAGVTNILPSTIHSAYGFAINSAGTVVGKLWNYNEDVRPVKWQNGYEYILPMFDGDRTGAAQAINDVGQIIGTSGNHGVLWEGNSLLDLGGLGGRAVTPQAISNGRQIVGYADRGLNFSPSAFSWVDGIMQNIGSLTPGPYSFAQDVNELGEIVGGYGDFPFPDLVTNGVLWKNGTIHVLPTLGGSRCMPWAMNNTSQIVGMSTTSSGDRHAFIYRNGEIVDLNTRIPSGSGWMLAHALDVNADGWIIGNGYYNGLGTDWLLIPKR